MNNSDLSIKLQTNKHLKEVCTFGIGGPAKFYVEVHSIEEVQEALIYCNNNQLPYFILGKGSNCLFDDKGFPGVVIHNKIDFKMELSKGIFHVGAGYSFSLLGSQTAREGWAGLEFASGIPATVGGAVYMNAGANGKEKYEFLTSVDFLDEKGRFHTFQKENLSFSYRTSPFQRMKGCIVGATFTLQPSYEARKKQLDIISYRINTQPYSEKSAGCIFRNPQSNHAGALIDKLGLKGYKIGGAEVSEMHANFIVNTENASAKDVLELIAHIKQHVKSHTEIELETEVRYIPYQQFPLDNRSTATLQRADLLDRDEFIAITMNEERYKRGTSIIRPSIDHPAEIADPL